MSDTKSATHSTYLSYETSSREWLREVPEHWETTTIRRYCRVFSGATPDRANPNYWNGGTIPWIASGDVNLRRIVKAQQFISEAGYKASSTRYINPGSLVLALAGQGRTKGMVATVECRTTCNQSLAAIEPSHQLSNYNFLAYFLESRYADIRALVGNGLRDGLNLEHIRGIQTPLPPLDEQAAIVRYLDKADQQIQAYISAKEKLIALLEELRQAIIHQAVTRGLDPNVRLKPSSVEWLGDVPEHWEVRDIKSIAEIKRGKFTHRPRNDPSLYDGPYPFIQTGDIATAGRVIKEYKQTLNQKGLAVSTMFPSGTLVMTIAANIGDVAILNFDSCFPDSIVGIIPVSTTDRNYLYHLLGAMRDELLREAPVNTQGNLNVSRIGSMKVPIPDFEEQTVIAEYLDQATRITDDKISYAERLIELIEEYRTRLIADVVTGKLDVRKAAEALPQLEPAKTAD